MLRQKIVVVIVMLAVFSTGAVGIGQESSQIVPEKSASLFGQIDQFGKKLVGDIFPGKSAKASKRTATPKKTSTLKTNWLYNGLMNGGFNKGRAGSVLDATQEAPPVGKKVSTTKKPDKRNYTAIAKRQPATTAKKRQPATTAKKRQPAERRTVVVKSSPPRKQPPAAKAADKTRPLHERLMGLSQSNFSDKTKQPAATRQTPVRKTKPAPIPPVQTAKSDRSAVAKPSPTMQKPIARKPVARKPIARKPIARKPVAQKVLATKTAARPTLARRLATKQSVTKAAANRRPLVGKLPPKRAVSGSVLVTTANRGDNMLFERQSPMLSVRTMGPRHITVGKESTYTVFIDNLGKAEAAEVVVTIELPQWADVLGAEPSRGTTRRPRSDDGRGQFDWQVGNLAAGGSEQIALRIVPRQSRPIDMGVSWNFKPSVSQTKIEVQEPKLEIRLNGPREVAFGKSQKYQLEITNSGNGPAEDVAITLMPVTAGAGMPSTHRLGVFPAGKKMVLDISLTARQKDTLVVKVDLHNEGKICARLDETILVRKAELEMIADGPSMQYVGTVATYRIRLRNTGNAAAKRLNVTASIPAQAKYLASDCDGKLLKGQGQVIWALASLPSGVEKIIELKCELMQAGFNRIDVETTADDNIQVSTAVGTNVEAMADLTLEVVDPTGPVPVGKEVVYQIRIRNRGSKQADGVEAMAYFSQGIEPISVSGGSHTLGPGQVFFRGIGAIEAGEEVLLKITARADVPGNHMFRAEVHCKPLDTKLVSEETTHFFNGTLVADRPTVKRETVKRQALRPRLGKRPTVEISPKTTMLKETRTADRRNPWADISADISPRPLRDSPDDRKAPTVAPPRYRSQQ